jgi:hypothetical protein
MKRELVMAFDSNTAPGVTTTCIVYDDDFVSTANSSLLENPLNRHSKRLGVLPQLVFASSLMWTTPLLYIPNLSISAVTRLPSSDQLEATEIQRNRRITLGQARKMALQAHRKFEEGLQRDRMIEARLINLTPDEEA